MQSGRNLDVLDHVLGTMRLRSLSLLPLTALTLLAAGPAVAQEPDQQIGEPMGASKVSSYGGVTVFSQTDPDSEQKIEVPRPGFEQPVEADPVFLVAYENGQARRLPVEPRVVPFDVDVGPDAEGRPVAVYSRCERYPDFYPFGTGDFPAYVTGEGCDLYRFDFATNRETKIAGASTAQASETLPSIWRDEIAFARVYESREGDRGRYPYLYVRRLDGDGGSQRRPGSSRGSSGLPGPTSLDLYGSRLAFSWAFRVDRTELDTQAEVRLVDADGDSRVVSRYRSEDPGVGYLSPQVSGGRLFYGFQRTTAVQKDGQGELEEDSVSSRIYRFRISTGDKDTADAPGVLLSTATDISDGVTYYIERDEGGGGQGGGQRVLRQPIPDF